jgi:prepilin-type N-terminal cleavage/methylation domain-containing protein
MNSVLRSGMTLVELLVVLTIALMLAAVTIPRLRPDLERSRIREAARSVQLYLSSARNQAITSGRSCGVQIERLANYSVSGGTALESGCSAMLSQVESPLGYCGDTIPALVKVTVNTNGTNSSLVTVNLTFVPGGSINPTLIKAGDMVQLGLQGPLYTVTANGGATATLDVSQGLAVPWTANSPPVPYKFFRQPVKSSAGALQLPSPSVIDLTYSGLDWPTAPSATASPAYWNGNGPNDLMPVQIMFAADGSVDRVYVDGQVSFPTTPICLLIGKRQNVNDPDPANSNMADFNCLWVAINPRTGLIMTTDLAATATPTVLATPAQVYASRAYARQSSAKGGN